MVTVASFDKNPLINHTTLIEGYMIFFTTITSNEIYEFPWMVMVVSCAKYPLFHLTTLIKGNILRKGIWDVVDGDGCVLWW